MKYRFRETARRIRNGIRNSDGWMRGESAPFGSRKEGRKGMEGMENWMEGDGMESNVELLGACQFHGVRWGPHRNQASDGRTLDCLRAWAE